MQAPSLVVHAAAMAGLQLLRDRGLLSFRKLPGDEKDKWRATPMGKAVHTSSLPTHLGEKLHKVHFFPALLQPKATTSPWNVHVEHGTVHRAVESCHA